MSFLEELAKKNIINTEKIVEIKKIANEKYAGDLENTLLLEFGVSSNDILKTKGEYYNIPTRFVDIKEINYAILRYISEESAKNYHFVPIGMKDDVLEIGITDPENIKGIDALQFISSKLGIAFKLFLISEYDYKQVMENYKSINSQVEDVLEDIERSEAKPNQNNTEDISNELKNVKKGEEEKIVVDAPIIKIVAVILKNAIEGNASDIHIEHMGEKVKVRYRVDGSLHTTLLLPANVHSGIIARIKILAKLHLDEKRKPQDGSFTANVDNRKVDFRVSTMPGYYGEKVAMRILDSELGIRSIDELGLSNTNLELLKNAISRPYGLILITGPTGSGKSTTLYSIMNELDKEKSNIVSLEDPVEYHIPSVNQSQVMPEIGYTFASGLRSILRQDPDIIIVGEIRDKETAQLAIQSALTGHLVFSTLHTNTSIGAIPRLVDMGVDPYLIAPTLILSVAQRLARMTCPSSRKFIPMDSSTRAQIQEQFKDLPSEYRDKIIIKDEMCETIPSPECPSGTKGRIAVFEMFKIDKELENIILKSPTDGEIYKIARKNGMLTMKEDAILKAIAGTIPYSEVYNFNSEND